MASQTSQLTIHDSPQPPPRDAHKELSSSASGSDDDDAKQQIMQKPLDVHDDVKKVRQRAKKFNLKHDSPKTKAACDLWQFLFENIGTKQSKKMYQNQTPS